MKNRPFPTRVRFALSGLLAALGSERSLRTQAVAAIVVLVLLLWIRPAPLWWALLALTVGFVLAMELLNTAIEHLADRLHPEPHPTIKIVKDCAAAAVLVASLAALAVAAAFLVDVLSSPG